MSHKWFLFLQKNYCQKPLPPSPYPPSGNKIYIFTINPVTTSFYGLSSFKLLQEWVGRNKWSRDNYVHYFFIGFGMKYRIFGFLLGQVEEAWNYFMTLFVSATHPFAITLSSQFSTWISTWSYFPTYLELIFKAFSLVYFCWNTILHETRLMFCKPYPKIEPFHCRDRIHYCCLPNTLKTRAKI